MGYWVTVHLIDTKNLTEKIAPLVKGNKNDLKPYFSAFFKTTVWGNKKNSDTEIENKLDKIHEYFSHFDSHLQKHSEFDKILSYNARMEYCNQHDCYYFFYKFFEYLLFSTCADFYPQLLVGKRSLEWCLMYPKQSLSFDLISMLDKGVGNSFFSAEGAGIISWLSEEDTKLLYYDRHNISSDDEVFLKSFLKMLEFAYENSLGLLTAVDLLKVDLSKLPGYKLIKKEQAKNIFQIEPYSKIVLE